MDDIAFIGLMGFTIILLASWIVYLMARSDYSDAEKTKKRFKMPFGWGVPIVIVLLFFGGNLLLFGMFGTFGGR